MIENIMLESKEQKLKAKKLVHVTLIDTSQIDFHLPESNEVCEKSHAHRAYAVG